MKSHEEPLSKFLNSTGENQGCEISAIDDAMHFNRIYWTEDPIQGQEDLHEEFRGYTRNNMKCKTYIENDDTLYRAVQSK